MQLPFQVILCILHSSVGLPDKQLQKTLSLQNVWRFNSTFHQDKNIFIYNTLVVTPKEEKSTYSRERQLQRPGEEGRDILTVQTVHKSENELPV